MPGGLADSLACPMMIAAQPPVTDAAGGQRGLPQKLEAGPPASPPGDHHAAWRPGSSRPRGDGEPRVQRRAAGEVPQADEARGSSLEWSFVQILTPETTGPQRLRVRVWTLGKKIKKIKKMVSRTTLARVRLKHVCGTVRHGETLETVQNNFFRQHTEFRPACILAELRVTTLLPRKQ